MAKADRFYKHMQILSSSWVSFSHGSNDATKVMGIIVVFLAAQKGGIEYVDEHGVPIWVILSCAAAMAVGTYLSVSSFRLIRTLGEKITKLHPINGFSAETGGAIIIQVASMLGLPVSTTHVVTSAVTGTGLASRLGGGQLESLPCYHAGLGRHPAFLRRSWPRLLLSPRHLDVGGFR